LKRWEASIQDYELLLKETQGDEEVSRGLLEAQVQLRKQRGEDMGMKYSGADSVVTFS
jgi:DnaJ family protein C protein 7